MRVIGRCAAGKELSSWMSCYHMSRDTTKPTESSLCPYRVAKDLSFLHADSEDSHQTGWMPRLIAGRTLILLVLSRGGSRGDIGCVCVPLLFDVLDGMWNWIVQDLDNFFVGLQH